MYCVYFCVCHFYKYEIKIREKPQFQFNELDVNEK